MYSAICKSGFVVLATVTLIFFAGVMVLHPFAPHEHGSVHAEKDSASVLHTGIVDRGQGMVLAILVFFVVTAMFGMLVTLLPALFQRGLQDVNIPTLLSLHSAFRGGILNTKAYWEST